MNKSRWCVSQSVYLSVRTSVRPYTSVASFIPLIILSECE